MRIEEIGGTPVGPPTQTELAAPQHKELVGLQLAPGPDAGTITLGKRLSWNSAPATFGVRSSRSSLAPVAAIVGLGLADRWQLSGWDSPTSDPKLAGMILGRERRVDSIKAKNNALSSILAFDARRAALTTVEFPRWPAPWCCTSGWRLDGAANVKIAAQGDGFYGALEDVRLGDRLRIESLAGPVVGTPLPASPLRRPRLPGHPVALVALR